jgi:hypothetical protein
MVLKHFEICSVIAAVVEMSTIKATARHIAFLISFIPSIPPLTNISCISMIVKYSLKLPPEMSDIFYEAIAK